MEMMMARSNVVEDMDRIHVICVESYVQYVLQTEMGKYVRMEIGINLDHTLEEDAEQPQESNPAPLYKKDG